jgi:isopentenyl-diphosphate delta-isomerase
VDLVVLVDPSDRELGTADKLEAHRTGALHRAVSVFAFDDAGRLLIQRRAAGKYHSGGLWSNSACTHPRPGESPAAAAARCLATEMGVSPVDLQPAFALTYRAAVSPTLTEHEFDHVFVAGLAGTPRADPTEASEWRLEEPSRVAGWARERPQDWTPWFLLLIDRVLAYRVAQGDQRKRLASEDAGQS